MTSRYFIDGHVHVGRATNGQAIKITAADSLTLQGILEEARVRKGIDMIGVIDAVCPPVQSDLADLCQSGELTEQAGGGLRYRDQVTLFCGAEVEVGGPQGGAAHFGVFVPTLAHLHELYQWLAKRQTNPSLSSQRIKSGSVTELSQLIAELDGIFIINHAFTPHKGLYGNCVTKMSEMVDPAGVTGLELGLSADTAMADRIAELANMTFVTNSDAHSLPKIAREYHIAELTAPTFTAYKQALLRQSPNRITANVGLWPALGKYHRTSCRRCAARFDAVQELCPQCGSRMVTRGVYDRLLQVADQGTGIHPPHRPSYIHQVPLEFVPGLGPRKRSQLAEAFGAEMNILHDVTLDELTDVVGVTLAERIIRARSGNLEFSAGAGGRYGSVEV